jgi:hypothetical protein
MAGTALGWDSPIENDGAEKPVLPKGTAKFRILKLEKKLKQTGQKKCPQADLTIELENEHGKTQCRDFIDLHTDSEWKIAQLLRAIGQRKHGEKVVPNWNKVEGATGLCEIDVRSFKLKSDPPEEAKWTGRGNEITKYLDPADGTPTAQPEPETTPAPEQKAAPAYKF